MSLVRFAMVCDRCHQRQAEYAGYLSCAECHHDVCEACCAVYDPDPPGRAVCKVCARTLAELNASLGQAALVANVLGVTP